MQVTATVLFNQQVAPGYWRIRLTAPAAFADAEPGQFVMVRVGNAIDPLLRRPFAVFDAGLLQEQGASSEQPAYFEMLYHVVGKGTAKLADMKAGQPVDILGPLGKGFVAGAADDEKPVGGR